MGFSQMRRFLFLFAIFMGFIDFAAADLRVAVADVGAVFENFSEASSLASEIKSKQTGIRDKFVSDKAAVDSKFRELEKQKSVLSDEVFNQKMSDLSHELSLVERAAAEGAAKVEDEYMHRVEGVGKKVKLFIDDYATEKKFDLVVHSNQVLYHSNSVSDITNEIVTKLNAQVGSANTNNSVGVSASKEPSKKKSSRS